MTIPDLSFQFSKKSNPSETIPVYAKVLSYANAFTVMLDNVSNNPSLTMTALNTSCNVSVDLASGTTKKMVSLPLTPMSHFINTSGDIFFNIVNTPPDFNTVSIKMVLYLLN